MPIKVKKPKKLYRYFDKRMEKHEIKKECVPQVCLENEYGTLWRCRTGAHDYYGYASFKEAKLEEIDHAKKEIYEWKEWLEKLLS